MKPQEIEKLQRGLNKQYKTIDEYFTRRYKMASTLERTRIKRVQKAISNMVDLEIQMEQESNQ